MFKGEPIIFAVAIDVFTYSVYWNLLAKVTLSSTKIFIQIFCQVHCILLIFFFFWCWGIFTLSLHTWIHHKDDHAYKRWTVCWIETHKHELTSQDSAFATISSIIEGQKSLMFYSFTTNFLICIFNVFLGEG